MLKYLMVAVLLTGVPVHSDQKVAKGRNAAQPSQADQRGTESSPLVVNEHAIHSDRETAAEAQKNAKQDHVDSVNIVLATVIAICAALQFLAIVAQAFIYLRQTNLLNKTLREIHAQNRNLVSRERARLSIYLPESTKTMTVRTDTDILGEFGIQVENLGTTPAFEVYVSYDAFACNAEEAPPSPNLYWAGISSNIEGGGREPVGPLVIHPRFNGQSPTNPFFAFLRIEITSNDVFQRRERIARFLLRREFVLREYDRATSTDYWMVSGGKKDNYESYAPKKDPPQRN